MARVLTILVGKEQMEKILKGEIVEGVEAADSAGKKWKASISKQGDKLEDGIALTVGECPLWSIFIEGAFIGVRSDENPGEAVREAFHAAGLTSLPEAVEVKAVSATGDIFMVFTLGGEAYCVPVKQFTEEVAKSSNWITARQARRPEIDALMLEIKKLKIPKG